MIFLGVNMTFFPQHFLGLNGIPRRYCDYPDGFSYWNTVSRLGRMITVVSIVFFLYIVWDSFSRERVIYSYASGSTNFEFIHDNPSPAHTNVEA